MAQFRNCVCAFGLILCILPAGGVRAEGRHFSFVYEAGPADPGEVEMENWVTLTTGAGRGGLSRLDFRHELEFGVTKQWQLALYLADWNYQARSADRHPGFGYSATALEAIYNLTDPKTRAFGLSLYQEIKGGDRFFESESKIILQKNFGRLIAAYNATLEAIWEGNSLREEEGEIAQSFGISWEFASFFSAGLEMVHEIVLPDWSARNATQNFFIGPNVSLRHDELFATIALLAQATRNDEEPDIQLRTIVGFEF